MWWLLIPIGCTPPPPPTVPSADLALPGPPTWPARNAPLHALDLEIPDGFTPRRIAIDPGHGSGENHGARTARCGTEADAMLDVARDLADRLEGTGAFEVLLTRESSAGPTYRSRADAAAAWGAEALLSLHLDARGRAWEWAHPHGRCLRSDHRAGFAILVADRDGDPPLLDGRLRLARGLSAAMSAAGFGVYDGLDYGDNYARDPMPGVFLDRRVLFMLRRPTMPSVIIETHHGLDLEEHTRWAEPHTREAFARATAAALIDLLHDPAR